jgi:hypothetical protein
MKLKNLPHLRFQSKIQSNLAASRRGQPVYTNTLGQIAAAMKYLVVVLFAKRSISDFLISIAGW